jgi:hypothetical protein
MAQNPARGNLFSGPSNLRERITDVIQQHPKLSLVVLTLIPRVALLLVSTVHRATPFGSPGHDGYLQIAQNLVANSVLGLGLHHLLTRGPLVPLLLSPGVVIGHPELWSAGLHLLASVATSWLVFAAAMSLTDSAYASFSAAALVTADPWLIWFVKIPMTTVTATFFVAAAVFYFAQSIKNGHRVYASLGLGAACALAGLDHPALIPLVGGFTLAILIAHWNSCSKDSGSYLPLVTRALASTAAMWMAFLAVLLPYAIRNYRIAGRFMLVSDGAGLSYFMGVSRYALSPYPWA